MIIDNPDKLTTLGTPVQGKKQKQKKRQRKNTT